MNKLMLATIALVGLAVAGCSDPGPMPEPEPEPLPPAVEAPVAEAAADAGVPTSTSSAVDQTPTDTTALPPDERSSEQTVAPESETLFY